VDIGGRTLKEPKLILSCKIPQDLPNGKVGTRIRFGPRGEKRSALKMADSFL